MNRTLPRRLHARVPVREAVPGQGHRPCAGRRPTRQRLLQRCGCRCDLVHRSSGRGGSARRLRRAVQALGHRATAHSSPALACRAQVGDRGAVQGRAAARRQGGRTGDRDRRRSRGRDDRPRDHRAVRLPRADPAPVAVGAQRCVDPQGPGHAQAVRRDAAAVFLRARPIACRLADRDEPEPPVHVARAPGRLHRRAVGGARADADAEAGRGS